MKTINEALMKILDVISIALMVRMVIFLLIQLWPALSLPMVFPGPRNPPKSV